MYLTIIFQSLDCLKLTKLQLIIKLKPVWLRNRRNRHEMIVSICLRVKRQQNEISV